MIYRRFCLEGVARSRVTVKIEALWVWRVAANILSLELVPPNWGVRLWPNKFSLYNINIQEIFHKTLERVKTL